MDLWQKRDEPRLATEHATFAVHQVFLPGVAGLGLSVQKKKKTTLVHLLTAHFVQWDQGLNLELGLGLRGDGLAL